MQVIIGIDLHKANHSVVAVNGSEDEISRLKVRATRDQVAKLLTWVAPFPLRLWAIEGAEGLGFLLAQQLVTVGETAVDVLATSAARTRVLGVGRSSINDPNDLMSVAVTALRTRDSRPVQSVGSSEVSRLSSKRNLDIGRQRSRTVSRLHALFRNRDHFAASTGAAPVEFSSGGRIAHRLSRRANRTLNAAIHLAAVTQLRHKQQRGLPRTQNQPGLTGLCHTGAEGSVHDIR